MAGPSCQREASARESLGKTSLSGGPMNSSIPTAEQAATVALWPTAAQAVGIRSRTTAYKAAHEGRLPFRVIEIGSQGRLVVPTAELRRVLGLDPAPEPAQQGAE
jgi:hypothetical protein